MAKRILHAFQSRDPVELLNADGFEFDFVFLDRVMVFHPVYGSELTLHQAMCLINRTLREGKIFVADVKIHTSPGEVSEFFSKYKQYENFYITTYDMGLARYLSERGFNVAYPMFFVPDEEAMKFFIEHIKTNIIMTKIHLYYKNPKLFRRYAKTLFILAGKEEIKEIDTDFGNVILVEL